MGRFNNNKNLAKKKADEKHAAYLATRTQFYISQQLAASKEVVSPKKEQLKSSTVSATKESATSVRKSNPISPNVIENIFIFDMTLAKDETVFKDFIPYGKNFPSMSDSSLNYTFFSDIIFAHSSTYISKLSAAPAISQSSTAVALVPAASPISYPSYTSYNTQVSTAPLSSSAPSDLSVNETNITQKGNINSTLSSKELDILKYAILRTRVRLALYSKIKIELLSNKMTTALQYKDNKLNETLKRKISFDFDKVPAAGDSEKMITRSGTAKVLKALATDVDLKVKDCLRTCLANLALTSSFKFEYPNVLKNESLVSAFASLCPPLLQEKEPDVAYAFTLLDTMRRRGINSFLTAKQKEQLDMYNSDFELILGFFLIDSDYFPITNDIPKNGFNILYYDLARLINLPLSHFSNPAEHIPKTISNNTYSQVISVYHRFMLAAWIALYSRIGALSSVRSGSGSSSDS